MKRWDKNEIVFLRTHYPNRGAEYCASKLCRTVSSINSKANNLKIVVSEDRKSEVQRTNSSKNKVLSFSLDNKDDLYVLGLMWADGYVHPNKNRVELSILHDDFDDIRHLFSEECWSISSRVRQGRRKITTVGNYQKDSHKKLSDYGFIEKSLKPPHFVGDIPSELLYHFVRGFFDGDGCFYVSVDGKQKQCSFSGTLNQNWSWLVKILDGLGVNYTVRRIENVKGDYSIVYVKCKSISKLGGYMYRSENDSRINRKLDKYNLIINL